MKELVEQIINDRLQSLSECVSGVAVEVRDKFANAEISLHVAELADATATVLNQTAVLAISKLSEMTEQTTWCCLTDGTLSPIDQANRSLIMSTTFAIQGGENNNANPS